MVGVGPASVEAVAAAAEAASSAALPVVAVGIILLVNVEQRAADQLALAHIQMVVAVRGMVEGETGVVRRVIEMGRMHPGDCRAVIVVVG